MTAMSAGGRLLVQQNLNALCDRSFFAARGGPWSLSNQSDVVKAIMGVALAIGTWRRIGI